jgi:hypothetical protein
VSLRSRRAGVLLLAVGSLMVAASATVAVAQTGGDSQLGFFDVTADATGVGASFGDPTSQPYPVATGFVPNSLAQLSAGPSGQAQSSILWPGPLIGNAGSLANVIGTPLPPEVVSNLNYPVVARASASGGGRDEKSLGPMKATVDGKTSTASTALTDVNAPGVISAARVLTESVSALEDDKVTSTATSELEGVDVGGVIRFGRVRTVAKGTTDGVRATTEQHVEVTGAFVNGQAATVDDKGLHVGGQTVPAGDVTGGAKPVLSPFGVSAYVTKPVEDASNGGAGHITSGSVVVVWSPPPPPDQFPDQLKSKSYTVVVLGGSSVKVSGTTGSAVGENPADDFFSPAAPEGVLPTPSFSPPADSGALALPQQSGAVPAVGSPAQAGVPFESATPLQDAAAVSDRVPFGWVLIGILGACLMGTGLQAIRQRAIGAAVTATHCPLERR